MSTTFEFDLPGIACINCVPGVESLLANFKAEGIQIVSHSIHVIEGGGAYAAIRVNSELSSRKIEDVICKYLEAYDCKKRNKQVIQKADKQSQKSIEHILKGGIGLLAGGTLLLLSIFGVVIPPLTMFFITAFCTALILVLGYESYSNALSKLFKTRTLTMDFLFMVSTLVAIGVSIAALFVPSFSSLLDAALLIYGFRHIGKAIEASVKSAVINDISFRDRVPRVVKMRDHVELRYLSDVKVDEVIEISPGEFIPLDGVLLEAASVYNDITTGSCLPKLLAKNHLVLAGMKVADKKVQIKVTATEEDSYLARMDRSITDAEENKAPIQERANEILQYFIPSVFVAAILAGVCVGICYDPSCAIQCAISVLVSACPCTLGIIVPLAIKIGLVKAADPKHGVLFKSGKSLEAAGKIDIVIFDLNGTLTEGQPEITQFVVYEEFSEKFLPYLYALESKSNHPIAKAICKFTQSKSLQNETIDVHSFGTEHNGLSGVIDGEEYRIGNQDFMQGSGIDVSYLGNTGHKIFFAKGQKIIGHFIWHDPLRKDAITVVKELQARGKSVQICTGADIETAKTYAKQLNIPEINIKANCIASDTKSDKRDHIKALQAQGKKVAMIGDAGNDALAVAASDLGVAIKTATADPVTLDKSHVVINSLTALLPAFSIAEQTIKNIDQNLVLSLCYNTAVLLLAGGLLLTVGCSFNPGIGVALMILQMCLVFLNAYRFKESAVVVDSTDGMKVKEDVSSREFDDIKDNFLVPGEVFVDSRRSLASPFEIEAKVVNVHGRVQGIQVR